MGSVLIVIIAIGFLGALLSLFKRTPGHKGDLIGAADRASAKLITKEVADGFRSGLHGMSDAELSAMMSEGGRLLARLEEKEKALAVRHDRELLANVRIDLQQVRVRLDWIGQERNRRTIGGVFLAPPGVEVRSGCDGDRQKPQEQPRSSSGV